MQSFLKIIAPFLKKYKIESIIISIAIIIGMLSFAIFIGSGQEEEIIEEVRGTTASASIYVDVSGAVVKPGLYKMKQGDRLKMAIDKAGGLSELADQTFFARSFNLARFITDQEKIYIPTIDEVLSGVFVETQRALDYTQPQSTEFSNQAANNAIDLNSASAEELDTLYGIGKVTAQKIIDGRPYSSLEELLDRKILKRNVYEQIKDQVTVN